MSYCSAIGNMASGEKQLLHKNYHDNFYGFPVHDDNELFCRLVLEINGTCKDFTVDHDD